MKKYLIIIIIIASIPLFSKNYDDDTSDNYEISEIPKSLYGELGYGWNRLSLAAGLRYWVFGLSMGLNGFANGMPNYAQYIPNLNLSQTEPLPNGYVSEKYVGLIVTGDLSIFLESFGDFIVSGSVGYYSQADSILAKDIVTGDRVRWKTEVYSGLTFGIGFDYPYTENYSIGILAHTKRGIGIRFSYIWY